VLLAALHLTVAGWNTSAGARHGRVGVMMPVNLRPPERFWEVVGNFASMVPISTQQADRVDMGTAATAVAAQTREIRREIRARGLVDLFDVATRSPVGIKRATSRLVPFLGGERLIDTAVLSNLGRLTEPPTLDGQPPEQLGFSPPCDRVCSVGIGVVTVAQSLMLSVRYRRELFDRAAAEAFTEQFVARRSARRERSPWSPHPLESRRFYTSAAAAVRTSAATSRPSNGPSSTSSCSMFTAMSGSILARARRNRVQKA
jgi:NRPS condensation-like uncharacterized protein